MKLKSLSKAATLLACLGLASCAAALKKELHSSAMFAPPIITLQADHEYQLKEGTLTLKEDQRYYSLFELSRLMIVNQIGHGKNPTTP